MTPPEDPANMRNGDKICSAHPLLIKMVGRIEEKVDIIDTKVDGLETTKAIQDKEDATVDKWKERLYGVGLTLIALVSVAIFEFYILR